MPSESVERPAVLPTITRATESTISILGADGTGPVVAATGDVAGGWLVRSIAMGTTGLEAVLETTSDRGGSLLCWSEETGPHKVAKPRPGSYANTAGSEPYLGHTREEVAASARDLLGLEVMGRGEPSWDAVVDILPRLHQGRYQILGSPLSREKHAVLPDGTICTREEPWEAQPPALLYSPSLDDARITQTTGYEGLLDDWMPAACYRFQGTDAAYELIALVEPYDYTRRPAVHVRLVRYGLPGYQVQQEWYHTLTTRDAQRRMPVVDDRAAFYAALVCFTQWWQGFRAKLADLDVPEARVSRWVTGSLALVATVHAGDHNKYGTRNYGGEYYADSFPPPLLDTARAFLAWGDTTRAVRYMSHYLTHVTREDGTFNFRGPSVSEYGQWLSLLDEAEARLGKQDWIAENMHKLERCGRFLAGLRRPVPGMSSGEAGEPVRLIYYGAEDDNREETNAYFSNNLWAVNGLRGLGRLLRRHGREEAATRAEAEAESLYADVLAAAEAAAVSTDVGPLLPSHLGYPADVWGLSIGPELRGVGAAAHKDAYLASTAMVEPGRPVATGAPPQRIRENTYANYRYYLESLSSMLLRREHAEALVRCREERGGELLATTRFMGWLDDWPVSHYARYLLETDRIDKYLLLYYSHMAHHGSRETLTYYEQLTFDGVAFAYTDCVNALLTVPLMTAWMLCHESADMKSLHLCRATPRAWLAPGQRISVHSLGTRVGTVGLTIEALPEAVDVALDLPPGAAERRVCLHLRLPEGSSLGEVQLGGDWLAELEPGGRVWLRAGTLGQVRLRIATCSA